MTASIPDPKARMCIYLEGDETKCYANKEALEFVAARILRIAGSDPREHYELHVKLALSTAALPVDKLGNENVWVVDRTNKTDESEDTEDDIPGDGVPFGYELTFMHVTEDELDKMKQMGKAQT